jgi:hypothetical protein
VRRLEYPSVKTEAINPPGLVTGVISWIAFAKLGDLYLTPKISPTMHSKEVIGKKLL